MNFLELLSTLAQPGSANAQAASGGLMPPRRPDPAAPIMPPVGGGGGGVPLPQMSPGGPAPMDIRPEPAKPLGDQSFTSKLQTLFGDQGQFSIRDILADAAAGMAAPRRGEGRWDAFGAGAHGAFEAGRSREVGAAKNKLSAEDRKMALEDRELERKLKQSGEDRAERKDKRDSRASELSEIKTVADIMKQTDPKATPGDKLKLNTETREYMKDLREANPGMEESEVIAAGAKYKQELMADLYGNSEGGSQAAPAQPGSSRDMPVTLPQAGARQAYEQLPSGTFFVNPKDGSVLQKP